MKSPRAFSLLCVVVFVVGGVVLTFGNDEFTVDEENVLILTEDDFQQALKKFKYLLVDFRMYTVEHFTLSLLFIILADIMRISASSR